MGVWVCGWVCGCVGVGVWVGVWVGGWVRGCACVRVWVGIYSTKGSISIKGHYQANLVRPEGNMKPELIDRGSKSYVLPILCPVSSETI